jgi:acyl CoA:acetate/3-ketoacid CoA transferase alpha subunit
VARRGVKDLTAISTSMGRGVAQRDSQSPWLPPELRPQDFFDVALMAELGQLKKGITSFAVGGRHDLIYPFEERLAERIRCARAGIAAFYTPVGPGTDVANGKEVRDFNGIPHVLETALYGDFALIRAWKADRYGNLIFRGPRTFNETMAGAARITVAEVDEVVPLGDLKPDQIHTPGVYVQRVVVRPRVPVTDWETPA